MRTNAGDGISSALLHRQLLIDAGLDNLPGNTLNAIDDKIGVLHREHFHING